MGTQGRPAHPAQTAIPVGNAPVSAREAREAFRRYSALLVKVNGVPLGEGTVPAVDRPVTRAEVVSEMTRLYRSSATAFRFIPADVAFDAAKFKIDAGKKPLLADLVRHGCIGRVSPLAVGPGPSLTPREFGDALGFFASRLAQMSHLPSPTFTPGLQDG